MLFHVSQAKSIRSFVSVRLNKCTPFYRLTPASWDELFVESPSDCTYAECHPMTPGEISPIYICRSDQRHKCAIEPRVPGRRQLRPLIVRDLPVFYDSSFAIGPTAKLIALLRTSTSGRKATLPTTENQLLRIRGQSRALTPLSISSESHQSIRAQLNILRRCPAAPAPTPWSASRECR